MAKRPRYANNIQPSTFNLQRSTLLNLGQKATLREQPSTFNLLQPSTLLNL
ncbi:hypothetical protein BJP36_39810 [Moorena producens JHB]|uniref:Uncharacterized protein n=1 Tax=Moorena producens (strain JHB) TaxID=1454205 RepID=A0A9Q9UWU3_MOOP1|nr:hypothetical protein [Moorena producens]WAN70203.1 hypothetical protein BJP36_39810 [Moorena producens JHB]